MSKVVTKRIRDTKKDNLSTYVLRYVGGLDCVGQSARI